MRSIALRLAECGLTLHPEKSSMVHSRAATEPHLIRMYTSPSLDLHLTKDSRHRQKAFTNFFRP